MKVNRIVITPTLDKEGRPRRSSKGPLFDASYEGQVIVLGSTEPGLDAARFLKARGDWQSRDMGCCFALLPFPR